MSDIVETDENETPVETATEESAEESGKDYSGRKIMCFVSKSMVPIEDTIEVEYAKGKSYRVLEQYVRFEQGA